MLTLVASLLPGVVSASGLGDGKVCGSDTYLGRIETAGGFVVGQQVTVGSFTIQVTSVKDGGEITGFTVVAGSYGYLVIHAGDGSETFSDPTGPFAHGLSFVAFCGTAVPTATNTAVPTSTNTAVPTATNTTIPTATNTAVATSTSTAVPTSTGTPDTCPGGADGFPECNPQIDAEVNTTIDCVVVNGDGSFTVTGFLSILNQSEHDQDIRITIATASISPGAADLAAIEAFFEGSVILNDVSLNYPFSIVVTGTPDSEQTLSLTVIFESMQGRGTVREPREDAEEFELGAKGQCAVPTETVDPTSTATNEPTATPTLPIVGVTEVPTETATTEPEPEVTSTPEDEVIVNEDGLPNTGAGSAGGPGSPVLLTTILLLLAGIAWHGRRALLTR